MDFSLKNIRDPLRSGVETLADKAAFAQRYGLILRACDASDALGGGPETPGYVFEELIDLSYVDGERLANVLAERLASVSRSGGNLGSQLKTLKTLRHLTLKGSRAFRKTLRFHDEHLKSASESGMGAPSTTKSTVEGNARLHQVRSIASQIRENLFHPDTTAKDNSKEPELPPRACHGLSGMGISHQQTGNYDGFGSAPARGTLGGKILEALEEVLTVSDERKEVLEMCLEPASRGDYKPVELPALRTQHVQLNSYPEKPARKHVAGKAGGGWESSDEEQAIDMLRVCLPVGEIAQEAHKAMVESKLKDSIDDYCCNVLDSVQETEEYFRKLSNDHKPQDVISATKEKIEDCQEPKTVLKLLLLLELYLRTPLVQSAFLNSKLNDVLGKLEAWKDQRIAVKAQKISLIIAYHTGR